MAEKMDIYVFDVNHGQSIFFHPHELPEFSMMVDCGESENFSPIDFLIENSILSKSKLPNLTLTNYDQDHFCGLPKILNKIGIWTITFPKNISIEELRNEKEEVTEAMEKVFEIRRTHTVDEVNFTPPYSKRTFYLEKNELEGTDCTTNNLSQIVFVEYQGLTFCIPGDIEVAGWKRILKNNVFVEYLKKTRIFFASHHGREGGYCQEIFNYFSPKVIIISDKEIIHGTQENMTSKYGTHVMGSGIILNGKKNRKVLTTRQDGHILISIENQEIDFRTLGDTNTLSLNRNKEFLEKFRI